MNHPLRFGIITGQNLPWTKLVEYWQLIEALGFDSVWVADHYVNPHSIHDNWYDGWTALAGLATQTKTIGIGTLVTNIIYRNPAVIAKQAMTIDHISNGRLQLGIGATSKSDPSHRMTGIEVWENRERVKRFKEIVEIIDAMLRDRVTNYHGQYYTITEALNNPAPIQTPRPPLVIASIGETTLKIAARHADVWNTYAGWNLTPKQTTDFLIQRNEMLDEMCAQIGRNPKLITRSLLVGLTQDRPFASIDAFFDYIGRMREAGMTEFIFFLEEIGGSNDRFMDREMMERIATQAIPAIKSTL